MPDDALSIDRDQRDDRVAAAAKLLYKIGFCRCPEGIDMQLPNGGVMTLMFFTNDYPTLPQDGFSTFPSRA